MRDNPQGRHSHDKFRAVIGVGSSVVDARQYVAMNVGGEKERLPLPLEKAIEYACHYDFRFYVVTVVIRHKYRSGFIRKNLFTLYLTKLQ